MVSSRPRGDGSSYMHVLTRTHRLLALVLGLHAVTRVSELSVAANGTPPGTVACDVVVVGGSVAGLSAALTAAKEGADTCLLVPTDWLGGQMTSNGIPALDFSSEDSRVPFNTTGGAPDTMAVNQAVDLQALLKTLPGPNYRNTCWVSCYCFMPDELEVNGIAQLVASAGPKLRIFRETVLINAETKPAANTLASQPIRIVSATAVQRRATASATCGGYGKRLSQSLPDWYSPERSSDFEKIVLTFKSNVWIDTSYNGELLALIPEAPYLQGIDEAYDGDVSGTAGNDTIGQSFTMTFHSHLHDNPVPQPDHLPAMNPGWAPNPFRASPAIHTPTKRLNWESLWTRRRSYHSFAPPHASASGAISLSSSSRATVPADETTSESEQHAQRRTQRQQTLRMNPPLVNNVSAGDVHLAAWSDFFFRYIFTSKRDTAATVNTPRWVGGYDLTSIDGAERYSYGAYRAYAAAAPPQWLNHTDLNSTNLGTCTGLSKMPYIRDGRRSVGVDNFVITINFTRAHPTDALPDDCVALMGHGFDIWGHRMMEHPMDNTNPGIAQCAPNDTICNAYPEYMREGGTTGYTCAPLRAFTNAKVANLVVGGYTMAATFMVNSALRMNPEEFQGGVAAGATGAHMALANVDSTEAALDPTETAAIQDRVRRHAPIAYNKVNKTFPPAVGYTCAAPLQRCVQVPGGGTFNKNNTTPQCPPSCVALNPNEWLAMAGSFTFDTKSKVVTFRYATRIKKSAVNSGLIPPNEWVAVGAQAQAVLTLNPSPPFKVDAYTYVLITCDKPACVMY
eukprot:m.35650 g.35650  ORF g.35650 m.35650 type:complete len:793 (+) comp5311_c0_seq1:32-2410(+)